MPTSNLHRASAPSALRAKFDALRTELADLAIALERHKRLEAADVALSLHALVGEMRDELAASETPALTSPPGVDPCLSQDDGSANSGPCTRRL